MYISLKQNVLSSLYSSTNTYITTHILETVKIKHAIRGNNKKQEQTICISFQQCNDEMLNVFIHNIIILYCTCTWYIDILFVDRYWDMYKNQRQLQLCCRTSNRHYCWIYFPPHIRTIISSMLLYGIQHNNTVLWKAISLHILRGGWYLRIVGKRQTFLYIF